MIVFLLRLQNEKKREYFNEETDVDLLLHLALNWQHAKWCLTE